MDFFVLTFAALVLQVGAAPAVLTSHYPGRFQGTQDNGDYCVCTLKSECTQLNEVDVGADVSRQARICSEKNMVCCPSNDTSIEAYNQMCQAENSKHAFPNASCCGRQVYNSNAESDDRIYKGQDSTREQYPWLVRIYTRNNKTADCSGVLIGARHVLTADHCIDSEEKGAVNEIGLGCGEECEKRINFTIPNRVPIRMKSRLRPDIAILMLTETAPFTNIIRPICLPPKDTRQTATSAKYQSYPEAGEYAVAGWGETENGQNTQKKHAVIEHMPNHKCEELVKQMCENHTAYEKVCEEAKVEYGYSLKGALICTGSETGNTCIGDSGGPVMQRLQADENSRYEAVGVITAYLKDNKECIEGGIPNINVNIKPHIKWIKKTARRQYRKYR